MLRFLNSNLGLPLNPEKPAIWQGEARHHCRKLPATAEERDRVPEHGLEDTSAPLVWNEREYITFGPSREMFRFFSLGAVLGLMDYGPHGLPSEEVFSSRLWRV